MAKIYRLKGGLFVREVENEVIIITEASVVHILKHGKALYKLLSQGCSFEFLVKILGKYSVNKKETENKLLNLINNLKDSDLAEEIEEPDYKEKSIKLESISGEHFPVLEKIELETLSPEGLIPVGCVSVCGSDNWQVAGYIPVCDTSGCVVNCPI